MAWKGKFNCRNPEKYAGDPTNIIYRSRIELRYYQYFDSNPDVVMWASEEFSIPYIKPTDMRQHRYFPDALIKRKDGQMILIEFKHSSDLKEPRPPKDGRKTRRFIGEAITWSVNQAKWAAAEAYCVDRGWKFMLMSEKELGKTY